MEKQTGCVHITVGMEKLKDDLWYGDSARVRQGMDTVFLIYQFMKDNSTSERKVLFTVAECDVWCRAGQDKVFVSDDTGGEGRAENGIMKSSFRK